MRVLDTLLLPNLGDQRKPRFVCGKSVPEPSSYTHCMCVSSFLCCTKRFIPNCDHDYFYWSFSLQIIHISNVPLANLRFTPENQKLAGWGRQFKAFQKLLAGWMFWFTVYTVQLRYIRTKIYVQVLSAQYAYTRIDIRIYAYSYTHIRVYSTYVYAWWVCMS